MRSPARIALTLLLALATVAVATGCEAVVGQAVKSGVESSTGVKVDDSSNSVTMTGKGGSTVAVGKGKLPDGFPEDVPVYEGTISAAIASKSDKGTSFMVGIETADAPADVFTWYEEELAAKGWTSKTSAKTKDGGLLAMENGELSLTVMIAPSGSGSNTSVSLSVSPRGK